MIYALPARQTRARTLISQNSSFQLYSSSNNAWVARIYTSYNLCHHVSGYLAVIVAQRLFAVDMCG